MTSWLASCGRLKRNGHEPHYQLNGDARRQIAKDNDWREPMSKMGGDTARFYRIRAQRNRRRARIRELRAKMEARKAASARPVEKPTA